MANKVKMTLVGLDGNAFALMGAFSNTARKQGWKQDEIAVVLDECKNGDYNHLLCTLMDNIEEPDNEDDEDDDTCPYCGGNCPNDEEHACDGYLGDIDGLCENDE